MMRARRQRGFRTRGEVSFAAVLSVLALALVGGLTMAAGASAYTGYSFLTEAGGSGAGDGLFNAATMPQRLAVHEESGKLFVADRGNRRVQVFEPTVAGVDYDFQIDTPAPVGLAIDQNTGDLFVSHGQVAAVNEVQRLVLTGATSGTFTLSFDGHTTSPLAFNAPAATIQIAMRALPSINGANVNVTGSLATLSMTFVGTLAGQDVAPVMADIDGLNPEASAVLSTPTPGSPALTHAIRKFNPDDPQDPTAYSPDGDFTSPSVGVNPGQIGALQAGAVTALSSGGLAVDPDTGDLLVADVGRNLVQRYEADGTFVSSFNGASGPRAAFSSLKDLAVNSQGDVITADGNAAAVRVDRLNSAGVHQATLTAAQSPVPNSLTGNGAVVAVNPLTDEVFVSSVTSEASLFNPPPSKVYQFEDDQLVASFNAPANMGGIIHGIAVRAQSPLRLYLLAGQIAPNNPVFITPIPRLQVFKAVVPATVQVTAATAVGTETATLNGSINPNGSPATWQFHYRRVGTTTWQQAPSTPASSGDGTDPVPIQQAVTGLDPNIDYEFKLVAHIGDVMSETAPLTFRTEVAPPVVETLRASFLTDQTARLVAAVNPRNTATTYRFEWGETSAYGNQLPADPVSAGSGGQAVAVSQELSGLSPSASYHFRVVATNEDGDTSFGLDQLFTTLATAPGGLKAARGYEVASKQPMGMPVSPRETDVSPDGLRVSYQTNASNSITPGEEAPHLTFLSQRGATAWLQEAVDLPNPTIAGLGNPVYLSRDFRTAVAQADLSFDPDDQNGDFDLYLKAPGQERVWISRSELVAPGEPQTEVGETDISSTIAVPDSSAMSETGEVVVFSSLRRLTEADPNPSNPAVSEAGRRLYRWRAGEGLSLVSMRPNGSAPTGPLVTLGSRPEGVVNSPHAVSEDGRKIFWSDATNLYAYIEGEDPLEIGPVTYIDAAPDGSRVYYSSAGRIYSFDLATKAHTDLTGDVQLRGPSAVAKNGQRIYFVSNSALAAEPSPLGHRPVSGQPNLYLLRLSEPGVQQSRAFIATLNAADGYMWHGQYLRRSAATSPDGVTLAFGSRQPITGKPTNGMIQMFVYNDIQASLACASCPTDGSLPAPSTVNGYFSKGSSETDPANFQSSGWQSLVDDKRIVSTDGSVYFDTATPLVHQDQNQVRDVYEFRNGHLRLLTTGLTTAGPSLMAGASVDGNTVMIGTESKLAPQDIEPGAVKAYAAVVGGGFEYRPPAPPCYADACQGRPGATPDEPGMATDGFRGSGNASGSSGRPGPVSLRVSRLKAGRGATARLRIRVSGPGRIQVRGRLVSPVNRQVRKGGPQTVPVRLSRAGQRRLAGKARVRAAVRVSYRTSGGATRFRKLTLAFTAPASNSGSGRIK